MWNYWYCNKRKQGNWGIKFKNEEIKLIQFADDLTCSLADINSGQIVIETFKSFELVSGLKLNKLKTQGMWLGNKKLHNKTF